MLDEARRVRGLPMPDGDDVIYHSTLRWLRFTAFSNALSMRDSIPRLVYGKCVAEGDRTVMPVALEVHHAVVQGLDVARFYEQFQEQLDSQAGSAEIVGLGRRTRRGYPQRTGYGWSATSKRRPLDPSPRPTDFRRPSQRNVVPSNQRAS